MTWPITSTRYDPNAPVSTDLFADIITKLASVVGDVSGIGALGNTPPIANGSFEVDASGTNPPTGWTYAALPGGSGLVTNTDSDHGAQCYRATHPGGGGNGGCTLTSTTLLPVSVGQAFELYFSAKATLAGVRVKVDAIWYDGTMSPIGSPVNVFDQNGSFPTVWTTYSVGVVPVMTPSAACFLGFTLTLGDTSTDPGASADISIDNITLRFRREFTRSQAYGTGGSSGNWTVPAGINRIRAWVWGGGGAGRSSRGGGSGGLVMGYLDVHPGQLIPYVVGNAGVAIHGTPSTLSNGVVTFTANGGTYPSALGYGIGGDASGGTLNLKGRGGTSVSGGSAPLGGSGATAGYNFPSNPAAGGFSAGNGGQVGYILIEY